MDNRERERERERERGTTNFGRLPVLMGALSASLPLYGDSKRHRTMSEHVRCVQRSLLCSAVRPRPRPGGFLALNRIRR